MLFHSFDYFWFLPLVFLVYWALSLRAFGGQRHQNVWLMGMSYVFYGWVHPWYAVLLAVTTVVDFSCARGIALCSESAGRRRKQFLWVSVGVNFCILGTMKYFDFFVDNFVSVFGVFGVELEAPMWRVLLPAGISFYTFQSCSYVVDVYRGQVQARRKFVDYGAYLSFFPQLVAGPIERAGHLLRQFEAKRQVSPALFREGVLLILYGLYKKRVIADTMAVHANRVFALEVPSFPVLWAGVAAFGVQIYADFSAYTDIARGSAKLLGFDIMRNFKHPYMAVSPGDFWRRWHISLSTWFRDYVYIPLGGSRNGGGKMARNVMITFLLSGLWHGAGWNFVLWGAWHGMALIAWHVLERIFPRFMDLKEGAWLGARRFLFWAGTLGMVWVGWLFFREHEVEKIFAHLCLSPLGVSAMDWRVAGVILVLVGIYVFPLVVHGFIEKRWLERRREWFAEHPWGLVVQGVWALALLLGLFVLACDFSSDFIYFQF